MKALRVTVNNKSMVIALDHPGVLNATVCCIDLPKRDRPECVELNLSGLDCQTDTHVHWNYRELVTGDKVTIEIIEDCDGDRPDKVETKLEEGRRSKEQHKEYVRSEARKLGWRIVEPEVG